MVYALTVRCPHCDADLAEGAAFCGVCGRPARRPSAGASLAAMASSVFELPVSRNARLARLGVVLAVDAALAIAGVLFIRSWLSARDAAAAPPQQVARATEEPRVVAEVDVPPPRVVGPRSKKAARKGSTTAKKTGTPTTAGPAADPIKQPPEGGGETQPPATDTEEPGTGTGTGTGEPEPVVDPPVGDPVGEVDAGVEAEAEDDGEASDSEVDTAEAVQSLVARNRGAIMKCYEQIAKQSAEDNLPEGRLEIGFTIQPAGNATDVAVVANATGSPELGDCVARLVASWKFPSPGSEPMQLVWPFVFKAPKRG
jgi:hypothetical protein